MLPQKRAAKTGEHEAACDETSGMRQDGRILAAESRRSCVAAARRHGGEILATFGRAACRTDGDENAHAELRRVRAEREERTSHHEARLPRRQRRSHSQTKVLAASRALPRGPCEGRRLCLSKAALRL
jgi:hypothetical protein